MKIFLKIFTYFMLFFGMEVFAENLDQLVDKKVEEKIDDKLDKKLDDKLGDKWFNKINLSGFVDVYYMYNDNKFEGRNMDTTRAFETYNKQFAVNSMELDIGKTAEKGSPWGFQIDLQNGQNNPFQEVPYRQQNSIYNISCFNKHM